MSKLKAKREAAGLSQSQLAEAAGVNKQMICFYEQTERDINKAQAITVYKIARSLGCKIEDILEL